MTVLHAKSDPQGPEFDPYLGGLTRTAALHERAAGLRVRHNAMLEVRDELRRRALAQAEQVASFRAVVQAAGIETVRLLWRHYSLCRQAFGAPNPCPEPPDQIPPAMLDGFTMGGRVPIEYIYGNSTYPDNWPLVYTDYEIDKYLQRIASRKYFVYGMTDVWLWEALERFPVKGLHVVNMGSLTPWYEANCLHHGARSTTIDYNRIITLTDRISTMTTSEWEQARPTFDVAWSISSFEHDGLGMYGDPLDPDGDFKAMTRMKSIVKPGGLLFLSVPVGKDKVLFNNARIYGRLRLPVLCSEWEQLATFGLQDVHMEGPGHIQPIIVLRNT